ncbi:hypothetical protein B5M42_022085 [Paenibacillus athensensis]|uniref:Uncharacterized protein n=1 Tax=Paenibacillus athensensis TaxID=1967502 RepID=A0A4Y8PWU8_9BACL|nr:hypothetical protein [Paenibacillus athensensis]MCD1261496.1 hypothetical protein [Paenibacillus athensensis]
MAIVIESSRLRVEIDEPGVLYRGSRFDWTGFVRQVTLTEGGHTYCSMENLLPGIGSGGIGLCNEFGMFEVFGYEEAQPGEAFVKAGVGLLTKLDDQPYDFLQPYPVAAPFPIRMQQEADNVRFVQDALPCSGYAFRLEKQLRVADGGLTISYALHNVGERVLDMEEYTHNFLATDMRQPGPDYALRFCRAVTPEPWICKGTLEMLQFDGSDIRWNYPAEAMFACRLSGEAGADEAAYYWELTNAASGVGVRESGSAPVGRLALWGVPHAVSPEVFVNVKVEPGQSQRWSRTYAFFRLEERA